MAPKTDKPSEKPSDETGLVSRKILGALRGLKYGSLEITVHEGRIFQIERKEKQRLSINCPEHISTIENQ